VKLRSIPHEAGYTQYSSLCGTLAHAPFSRASCIPNTNAAEAAYTSGATILIEDPIRLGVCAFEGTA